MKSILSGGRGSGNRAASGTFYGSFTGLHSATSATTESGWPLYIPVAGTFSRMAFNVTVNTRGVSTYTSRVNGADGNQSISVGASATGQFVDATNSDTVAALDTFGYKIVTGAGGTTFQDHGACVVFEGSDPDVSLYGYADIVAYTTVSTTHFTALNGAPQLNQTEAAVQLKFWKGGTLAKATLRVSANTRPNATSIVSRINGADGNISMSVAASTTGLFSDLSGSDTIADGDLVCWAITLGATAGSFTPRSGCVTFSHPDHYGYIHGAGQNLAVNANLTRYSMPSYISTQNATESFMQIPANMPDIRLANLRVRIGANTVTATSTYDIRKAGAGTVLSVSIGSSATGDFEDTTGEEPVSSETTLLSTRVVTGATGTSLTITSVGMLVVRLITLAATGGGAATGSAGLNVAKNLLASGTGAATGSATLNVTEGLQASGTGVATGTATLTATSAHNLRATGSGSATGSALLNVTRALTATASGVASSVASLNVTKRLLATGTGAATGSAVLQAERRLQAIGGATAGGSAVLTRIVALSASGAGVGVGVAGLYVERRLQATGNGAAFGTGRLYSEAPVSTQTSRYELQRTLSLGALTGLRSGFERERNLALDSIKRG